MYVTEVCIMPWNNEEETTVLIPCTFLVKPIGLFDPIRVVAGKHEIHAKLKWEPWSTLKTFLSTKNSTKQSLASNECINEVFNFSSELHIFH